MLGECGIDRDGFTRLVERHVSEKEIEGGPHLNPACYMLMSVAEGMAAGLGAFEVTAEHVLLGYLWNPGSEWQLEHLGSRRQQRVRTRLADLGVSLPQAELPATDPRRWGPKVDVSLDELWVLLRELPYVLPPDAQLAFNHDWKKGWISATEGVDLAVYIPLAQERHRRMNLPPDGHEA
ncbi:MAG: hypothetical protein M3Z06_00550 [Actinomycetota bacterium]|nr:hypothetical protein [Actinomycetota bacterium]